MATHSQQEGEATRKQRQAEQDLTNARVTYNLAHGELSFADEGMGAMVVMVDLEKLPMKDLVAERQKRNQTKTAAAHALRALEQANYNLGVANEQAKQIAGARGIEVAMGQGQGEGNEAMSDDIAGVSEVAGDRGGEYDLDGGEGDGVMGDIAGVPEVAGALDENEDEYMGEGDEEADELAPLRAVPVSSVVNCDYEEKRDNQAMTLVLPRAEYIAMEASRFQHDWMTRLNFPLALLDVFKSKYKLSDVIREGAPGAIIIGDEIRCTVAISATHAEIRTATVTAINNHVPTLELRTQNANMLGQAPVTGKIRACTGPTQIVKRFWAMRPRPVDEKPTDPWGTLLLRRNGQPLGTMNEVRHSLHRWKIEMAAWDNHVNPSD